ncbi:MAG: phage tail protein [Chitinophagales bacterium]
MEAYFIGQIVAFGGNFAPKNWAFCEGQLLSITSNDPLFTVLGTTYGGDGRTTFGLPDLRGREAIGAGPGPGLQSIPLASKGGVEVTRIEGSSLETADLPNAPQITAIINIMPINVIRAPFQSTSYIIALVGPYPSRT